MRPVRYSINITLDGCCDHRALSPDEDLHRHAADEMMEAAWRSPAPTGAKKYVVSSTLDRVDWNAELVSQLGVRLRGGGDAV